MSSEEIKALTKIDLLSDLRTHENSLILDDKMI